MTHIRWFDEVRAGDRPTVGGKCASLGELISAGIAVPQGFAVTVDAYAAHCAGFRDRLAGAAPGDAGALVRAAAMPAQVEAEVQAAYADLCRHEGRADLPVAVRSSAVAEDGDAASFAGQQETYL